MLNGDRIIPLKKDVSAEDRNVQTYPVLSCHSARSLLFARIEGRLEHTPVYVVLDGAIIALSSCLLMSIGIHLARELRFRLLLETYCAMKFQRN